MPYAAHIEGMPAGPVVIIGSDIPGIEEAHIAAAFGMLGSHDAVVGPAPDGGYWLIGLKRVPKVSMVFDDVRWSHPETFKDTMRSLHPLRVGLLDFLDDVDTGEAFYRLRAGHVRLIPETTISSKSSR